MKKIIILINFVIISLVSYSLNFSVVPTRFEVELGKITTNEVYIINNTTEPMRLEAYVESDKKFGENYNLNEDIVIFPKKIFVKPGARQTVRFRVKPNSEYSNGEYKSYITFKEVPYDLKSEIKTVKRMSGANVSVLTEIGIPVYGYKGDQIVEANIEKLDVKRMKKSISVDILVESKGNSSLKLFYELVSVGLNENNKGKIGMSSREGKVKISAGIPIPEKLLNKKIKLIIKDQNNKVYYDKTI
ncbi:fimbria/pilus periplasmic chaperone [Fusobacterium sp.]|uniref:fimbria/pilus periplasmic chaperone n=1 Tax=Fusobacterium sp. TaxID=68766 RepID=UPI00262AC74E|nr:fimbria/pilus periplasmic chaperone [Fusobacterium sp.]